MPAPAALLRHRDDVVIDAFVGHWQVTRDEAAGLFEDLVAWLWLHTRPGAPRLAIDEALYAIDEMWHEFVLHTDRYARFCASYLGGFVHHAPMSAADPAPTGSHVVDGGADLGQAQAAFIARELGVDRLLRWYVELPRRYDEAWFRTARKHAPMSYQPTPALVELWQQRQRRREAPRG